MPDPAAHHRRTDCRACTGTGLVEILDLGMQPLANAFLRAESDFAAEARYPLTLHGCTACGLLQRRGLLFGALRQVGAAACNLVGAGEDGIGSRAHLADDAGEALGHAPKLVPGALENFKLTWPADFALAERLLRTRA